MGEKAKWIVIGLLVLFAGRLLYTKVWLRPSVSGEGPPLLLDVDPVQEALPEPVTVWVERDGERYQLIRHHTYEISGRVLVATTYDFWWTSEFFDVDLALIWGPRRDALQQRFTFEQNGRWLFWRTNEEVSEADRRYVTAHTSNNHLIPAEGQDNVARAIRWIEAGDEVRLRGFLVDVRDRAGDPIARSSTIRTDQADGACEVVWVEEVQIGTRVYR